VPEVYWKWAKENELADICVENNWRVDWDEGKINPDGSRIPEVIPAEWADLLRKP
jgi:hypothetical protein